MDEDIRRLAENIFARIVSKGTGGVTTEESAVYAINAAKVFNAKVREEYQEKDTARESSIQARRLEA